MRILFLDDNPARAAAFRTKYPDLVWVKTCAECIDRLQGSIWDMVCLDYDLADGQNAVPVYAWIGHHKPTIGPIVIHSTNLAAGTEHAERLRELGEIVFYVPFTFAPGGPFNL